MSQTPGYPSFSQSYHDGPRLKRRNTGVSSIASTQREPELSELDQRLWQLYGDMLSVRATLDDLEGELSGTSVHVTVQATKTHLTEYMSSMHLRPNETLEGHPPSDQLLQKFSTSLGILKHCCSANKEVPSYRKLALGTLATAAAEVYHIDVRAEHDRKSELAGLSATDGQADGYDWVPPASQPDMTAFKPESFCSAFSFPLPQVQSQMGAPCPEHYTVALDAQSRLSFVDSSQCPLSQTHNDTAIEGQQYHAPPSQKNDDEQYSQHVPENSDTRDILD